MCLFVLFPERLRLARGVFSSDSSESSRPLPLMRVGCVAILVGAELSICLAGFRPFCKGGLGVGVGEIFSVLTSKVWRNPGKFHRHRHLQRQ